MGSIDEKDLWQAKPSTTSPVDLMTATFKTIIKTISVANISAGAARYTLYIDQAASGYSTSKTIAYNIEVQPGATWICDSMYVLQPGAKVGFQTDTASAFTVSGYGAEILP